MTIIRSSFLFILLTLSFSGAFAEAVWMRYPAISPDGDNIVFSYQDDLWLMSSHGGEARALTRHAAHEKNPVWSHDGSKIAFASNRHGNYDVFVIDLASKQSQRMTFHSSDDIPSDFTMDNASVIFSSVRVDDPQNAQFPYGRLGELYQVNLKNGDLSQLLSLSAEDAKFVSATNSLLFHNKKGYEDPWRKHHTSSVTRDIVSYSLDAKTFTKLTDFAGEDRNPIPTSDGLGFYYLSEESGSFNVWYKSYDGKEKRAITKHSKHPVRFLSGSTKGELCYGFDGEIYTIQEGKEARKLNVSLWAFSKKTEEFIEKVSKGATEFALSPDGKELAFILKGDVFAVSIEHGVTKTVTNTPWQERNVSFSPDGRSLLYAAEKGTSWSIYSSSIVNEEEKHFYTSTVLSEKAEVETDADCFQPAYSPDGLEIAFLEARTTLRVKNIESTKVRTVLEGSYNYSYQDGDQWYQWSPDSKWFLVDFNDANRWMGEIGLIKSSGKEKLINLSQSGYADNGGKWMAKGQLALFVSDRYGMRSHGSWGAEGDVMGVFLSKSAFDKYNKTPAEIAEQKIDNEDDKKDSDDEEATDISIDLDGIEDRKVRLSLHSSRLSDALVDVNCQNLFYLSSLEKGSDLWKYDMKKKAASRVCKFDQGAHSMKLSKDEKTMYVLSGGKFMQVSLAKSELKPIPFSAQRNQDYRAERDYLYQHVWRQTKEKFYKKDMHGVDWDFYYAAYKKFLPHINNNHDFAELLSELLGELNASHTGCRYNFYSKENDRTASLGIFIDFSVQGKGVKILDIMPNGPLENLETEWKPGSLIQAINGVEIKSIGHFYQLLNHQEGKRIEIAGKDSKGKAQKAYVKPIGRGAEMELLYQRWLDQCRETVNRLSDNKVAYVHVRGMNDASFRHVYDELLGKQSGRLAVIVDTRFNGGGWLHDDLATLLAGESYVDFVPRGQKIGTDPHEKWNKPSCVLASEGNYSDAHAFPWVYQTLGIGPVIGMPVPGTMTAVWWERQQDPSLVFGIPQVGTQDANGDFLENKELQPDVRIDNSPNSLLENKDLQLEKAIEVLLQNDDK